MGDFDWLITDLRNKNNVVSKDSGKNTPYFHGFYLGRAGALAHPDYDRDYFLGNAWADGVFDMGVEDGKASLQELPYPTPNRGDD